MTHLSRSGRAHPSGAVSMPTTRDPQRRHTKRCATSYSVSANHELPRVTSQIGLCVASCPQSLQWIRHITPARISLPSVICRQAWPVGLGSPRLNMFAFCSIALEWSTRARRAVEIHDQQFTQSGEAVAAALSECEPKPSSSSSLPDHGERRPHGRMRIVFLRAIVGKRNHRLP